MGFDEGGRVMGIIIIDERYESEKFLILIIFWDIQVNQFSIHPSIDPSTATRIACRLAPKVRSARSVVDVWLSTHGSRKPKKTTLSVPLPVPGLPLAPWKVRQV
jgi:hypothetical protein